MAPFFTGIARGFFKGAAGAVAQAFSASGGNILDGTTAPNGYKYHTFSTSGSLVVTGTKLVDILVVAGGGGGGGYYGAGGGGGGVAQAINYPLTSGTYPIIVGGGGAGRGPNAQGDNGSDSNFNNPVSPPLTITSKGGGGGGGSYFGTVGQGKSGGSGGGSGGDDPSPASGQATQPAQNPGNPFVTNYGYPGGWSFPSGGYAPAGGGGSGQEGTPIPGNISGGGRGGNGAPFPNFAYPYVGLVPVQPLANSPSNDQYAGGGGAGGYSTNSGVYDSGPGQGGGGKGYPAPGVGIDRLGGGGGGGHPYANPNPRSVGDKGGDGIVIIRYLP